MATRHRDRIVDYRVVHDVLERVVTFPHDGGRSYTHRCTRDVYREVAFAIEEAAGQFGPGAPDGVTMEEIARAINAPYTQVNVALEFMKERGCVTVHGRRSYPASKALYEDAMCEFMFLAECTD